MEMTAAYPTEAAIEALFAAWGLEVPDENNDNYIQQFKQCLYSLLDSWPRPLRVWCPSTTTYNVVGGPYNWRGTVKTYAPGAAVNPTDNDITYIWLDPDNTVGYAVDGTGWPTHDHLKLAEITVDSDGVIAAVTDKRGQSFLQHKNFGLDTVVCCDGAAVAYDNQLVTYEGI